jgi:hypothetical protein
MIHCVSVCFIIVVVLVISGSQDSSVGIETGYGLDDQGGREFESR